MTLEFKPYFQIDPNAQSPQQRSLSELNKTFDTVGTDWTEIAKLRAENRRSDALLALKQSEENRAAAGNRPISDYMDDQQGGYMGGQSVQPPSYPQSYVPPSGPNFSGADGSQMNVPETGQMPIDHTSHFQNWMAQGQPMSYEHPDYGSQPQQPNPMQSGSLDWNTYRKLPGPQAKSYAEFATAQSNMSRNNAMKSMYENKGQNGGEGTWHFDQWSQEWIWLPKSMPGAGAGTPPPAGGQPGGPKPLFNQGGGQPAGGSFAPPRAGTRPPGTGGAPGAPGMDAKTYWKLQDEMPKAQGSLERTVGAYDDMIKMAKAIRDNPDLGYATGLASGANRIWSTSARQIKQQMETLKSQQMLNVMGGLKEMSATGATGMGGMSDREGATLQNSAAPLDLSVSTPDVQRNIDTFIKTAERGRSNLIRTFNSNYGRVGGKFMPRIKVRNRATGQTGTVSEDQFNEAKHERI